jgi:hypothetical protein
MNTLTKTKNAASTTNPAHPIEITPSNTATPETAAAPRSTATPFNPPPPSAFRARADALIASLVEAAPHAGALSDLACETLSPAGCVDAVLAWERLTRHAHAGLMSALSALAHATSDDKGLAESEISAALAWSPTTAQNRLAEADVLARIFPSTLQHLSEGSVSIQQARALTDLTAGLGDSDAQAVEARVLSRMPEQSATATRQAIRRAVLRTDPDAAAKRHERKRERRRVELIPEDDGMATLNFYLPADVAQMAMRTLTELAHSAKRKAKDSGDKRTLDQRRADLLPVLLHHAANGGTFAPGSKPTIPARVNVTVSIDTLLGLTHEPGQLQGYGPICPEQTRRIAHAHAARWNFLLTSSDGTLVDASTRSYTPTSAIKHFTKLRHSTCVFPHCSMPSDRCDLDHNQSFATGGITAAVNLAPLCRRHHNHKTRGDWDLHRIGDIITWISKQTVRIYTTAPTRYPLAA